MMSTDADEKAQHERQLLRLLARGDREIAAGKGYDLEPVMAETAALSVDEWPDSPNGISEFPGSPRIF
jgi:hypothetical protein